MTAMQAAALQQLLPQAAAAAFAVPSRPRNPAAAACLALHHRYMFALRTSAGEGESISLQELLIAKPTCSTPAASAPTAAAPDAAAGGREGAWRRRTRSLFPLT